MQIEFSSDRSSSNFKWISSFNFDFLVKGELSEKSKSRGIKFIIEPPEGFKLNYGPIIFFEHGRY